MSPIPALRTYTFKSAQSALKFSTLFTELSASLQQNHSVSTTGIYISRTKPTKVLAIVNYPSGSEPATVMANFVHSESFRKTLGGFDLSELESIDEDILESVKA